MEDPPCNLNKCIFPDRNPTDTPHPNKNLWYGNWMEMFQGKWVKHLQMAGHITGEEAEFIFQLR